MVIARYIQFLCGGGQKLLRRQFDRLLASKSQNIEGMNNLVANEFREGALTCSF